MRSFVHDNHDTILFCNLHCKYCLTLCENCYMLYLSSVYILYAFIGKIKYDSNKSALWELDTRIKRQIINYLRKNSRGKCKILNDAVAIDDMTEGVFKDTFNLEMNFVSKDIIKDIMNNLTDFESVQFIGTDYAL